MKKIIAVLLALVMLLGAASCGEQKPKPEDTVKAFCEGMKNFDMTAIQACVEGEFNLTDSMLEEAESLTGLPDYLKTCAADLKYSIGSATTTGETATVKVDFDYVDASEIFGEVFYEFFAKAMELAFGGASEDEAAEAFDPILQEKSASMERGAGHASVDLVLKQADDAWKIIEVPEDILRILTADMEKGMEIMSDKLAADFEASGWTSTEEKEPVEYPISNEVLIDNEFAKMTIVSGGSDEWGDAVFQVLCENKTEDKELSFSIDNVVMNGWTTSAFLSEHVTAGKSANAEFTIYESQMESVGLDAPEKLVFLASVGDEDAWWTDEYFARDTVTVYPTGLSDSQVDMSVRALETSDTVVIDQDGIRFAFISMEKDDWDNYKVSIYVRNETDMDLSFSMEDVSVDGYMIDPYWGGTVYAGTQLMSEFTLFSDDLEANGIDVPTQIEYTLLASDVNDWDKDYIINDTFVYEP